MINDERNPLFASAVNDPFAAAAAATVVVPFSIGGVVINVEHVARVSRVQKSATRSATSRDIVVSSASRPLQAGGMTSIYQCPNVKPAISFI